MKDLYFLFNLEALTEYPSLDNPLKEYLKQQSITQEQPGKITADINTLLNFIQAKKVTVSQTHNLISLKYLSTINEQLSYPIETNLKRPQQKSYPYINGLYLLLRSSALCQIIKQGKTNYIVVNQDIRQQWQQLNLSEQYFNLLESWLWWAELQLIGEDRSPIAIIETCLKFWHKLPPQGIQLPQNYTAQDLICYPGDYNIALLHLFGLIDLEFASPLPNKGWRIKEIKPTQWGEAIIALITEILRLQVKQDDEEESEENVIDFKIQFNILQSEISSYFPEYKNTLIICQPEFKPALYILKISLDDVWRKISISNKFHLDEVVDWVVEFFEFDPFHLHKFIYRDTIGREIYLYEASVERLPYENFGYSDEYRLGDLPLKIGQNFSLIFDLMQEWNFILTLEKIEPLPSKKLEPQLLESHGEPPEDDQDDGFFLVHI